MKTYSEIKEVAYELYGASSSRKEEWVEEYEAYLNGDKNTVWNDEGFADWTEEEKKECLDIILEEYKDKEDTKMKKYVVCENTTELRSSSRIVIADRQDLIARVNTANEYADRTPLKEYEFETEEEARAKFDELKPSLGCQEGHWALYTLTIDELYIEVYEVDEDGETEYWGEIEHAYGEPAFADDLKQKVFDHAFDNLEMRFADEKDLNDIDVSAAANDIICDVMDLEGYQLTDDEISEMTEDMVKMLKDARQ